MQRGEGRGEEGRRALNQSEMRVPACPKLNCLSSTQGKGGGEKRGGGIEKWVGKRRYVQK